MTTPEVPPFVPAISTTIFYPNLLDPPRHLKLIADAGFSCIELCCNNGAKDFDAASPQARHELVSVCSDLGITIRSVHAPGVYPRTHVDEAMGREYLDATKAHLDFAAELGAGVVVLHRLKTGKPGPPEWDRMMHAFLDELAEYVLPLPVVIGLENLNWRVDAREDLGIVRSYGEDAMGFVLDTGHAHMFEANPAYLANCGTRLCSVHIHDNDGQSDLHWLPGAGTMKWESWVHGLVQSGYKGPLLIEVQDYHRQDDLPGLLDDCMASLQMLRSYLPGEYCT